MSGADYDPFPAMFRSELILHRASRFNANGTRQPRHQTRHENKGWRRWASQAPRMVSPGGTFASRSADSPANPSRSEGKLGYSNSTANHLARRVVLSRSTQERGFTSLSQRRTPGSTSVIAATAPSMSLKLVPDGTYPRNTANVFARRAAQVASNGFASRVAGRSHPIASQPLGLRG
jgi:hypothetical protein